MSIASRVNSLVLASLVISARAGAQQVVKQEPAVAAETSILWQVETGG
jgi:hypothetical protein